MTAERLTKVRPGEILLEEFLMLLDLSQNALAWPDDMPPRQVNEIVPGKHGKQRDRIPCIAA